LPKYDVVVTVSYSGTIEASSESDAENKAFSLWGDNNELTFDGVDEITVEELEEYDDE
jgi:hypothetical protein